MLGPKARLVLGWGDGRRGECGSSFALRTRLDRVGLRSCVMDVLGTV